LLDGINGLGEVIPLLAETRMLIAGRAIVEANGGEPPRQPSVDWTVKQLSGRIEGVMRQVHARLTLLPLPQGIAGEQGTVAAYCFPSMSLDASQADFASDRALSLYFTLLARAARITLEAEAALDAVG
jgi:hypothetical protein